MSFKPTASRGFASLIFALSTFGAFPPAAEANAATEPPPISRAEVLAELAIYQESGLALEERVAAEVGHETAATVAARERHAQLRRGERHAELIAKFSTVRK
ncbi:hypothetical protein [Mitsuaria sp. 7]|uniref:hypothetical protein n=1 Tax=Mitsuaria sp. 7 TaxID=1658665 RepID=UPI0007DD4715|nr:hypothetical protein [Mitsuaria sp. 7]ANH67678.1 hypothetical protein ABE85_09050 [Mitsuaria sp. 7]